MASWGAQQRVGAWGAHVMQFQALDTCQISGLNARPTPFGIMIITIGRFFGNNFFCRRAIGLKFLDTVASQLY